METTEDIKIKIPDDAVSLQLGAAQLGLSVPFIKRLIRAGKVATFRLGSKRLFISPAQVRSLLVPQQEWWWSGYTNESNGGGGFDS